MFRGRVQRLHFIGIGGIGMSGIAEVLLNLGFDIHGSDLSLSKTTERLRSLGADIKIGHAAENLNNADVVVTSTAVSTDNPEVREAHRQGVPVIRRAEMLAELMRLKYGIAVAGTHGKTTTTSLLATILGDGGIDPTVVIGGRLKSISTNAKLGAGEYLLAEADESDGSFLNLVPTLAIITNIDPEHLDHWTGGMEQMKTAFTDFANKVPFYGCSVLCLDHPTVQSILPKLEKRYLNYGFTPQADYRASNIRLMDGRVEFSFSRFGEHWGTIVLNMIGRHNVQNSLAALAVADEIGVPMEVAAASLESFQGVGRRFEIKGEVNGVLVVDDYAHHPAEIQATLVAARESYRRRMVVLFQPHRYSRTRDLMADFATCFHEADVVLVTDVYAASEQPIEGVSAKSLVDEIRKRGHHAVDYIAGGENAWVDALVEHVRPGDMVLTLGAGNIVRASERLMNELD